MPHWDNAVGYRILNQFCISFHNYTNFSLSSINSYLVLELKLVCTASMKCLVKKAVLTLQEYPYLFSPSSENSNEYVSNAETTLALLSLKWCKINFWFPSPFSSYHYHHHHHQQQHCRKYRTSWANEWSSVLCSDVPWLEPRPEDQLSCLTFLIFSCQGRFRPYSSHSQSFCDSISCSLSSWKYLVKYIV
jgi:hypothetical protein